MKRVFFLWIALLCGLSLVKAQKPENVVRNVLCTLEPNMIVNQGEFQMELNKAAFFDANSENPWFSFVYVMSNRFTETGNIMVNNRSKINTKSVKVRTYKIGPTLENCVFVVKNEGPSAMDMGHNMELIMANAVVHPVCDSVLYLNDDGYVYSENGRCYYSTYKRLYDNNADVEMIVWLDRKVFDPDKTQVSQANAEAFARLSKGDVYFESSEGHYYYLYRDAYMPYTVMVVDNKVIELFDVYNEDNLRVKFSYNGQHWMAVGKECFWVDGTIKSVEGHNITDFVITNDGHYGYIAVKKGESQKGEVVVYDGEVIRRNADVCYFGLNGEGSLKVRFVSGDRYLQYENDKIADVTGNMVSVCYPHEGRNRKVQVSSTDGDHKLTYQRGVASVEIDGVKMASSEPCHAIFDQRNNCFLWNAIEQNNMKTELVIYRYTVDTKLLKRLF